MISMELAFIAWFALVAYLISRIRHTINKVTSESRSRLRCVRKTYEQVASDKNHH
jgi:hypothetical protein